MKSTEKKVKREYWSMQDIADATGYTVQHIKNLSKLPGFPVPHGAPKGKRGQRFLIVKVRALMRDMGYSVVKEPGE